MPFSTKSYLAGVGTVVAAITIGFSGGFFLAPSTDHVEQNRLQRVISAAPVSNPAPPTAVTSKLEIAGANAAPTPAIEPPPRMIPVMAKAVEPAPARVTPKTTEPARGTLEEDRAAQPNSERMRATGERKRAREQRTAERRKQREIELAVVAVKRVLRDRHPQQVADRTEAPRFGFFGEN